MDVVELWLKDHKKVAFIGYSWIQLSKYGKMPLMEEGSSSVEKTIREPIVEIVVDS